MDELNMNTTVTEDVAESTNSLSTPRMTKEEVQEKSDEELLQMIQKAPGHTGKDFSDYMNCDFSYTYLTGLLRDRGYENGWHKTSEGVSPITKPTVIQMKKSEEESVRQSYMIDKPTAEKWKKFNQHVPYKTVTLGWALRRFMDDYESGRIKFELEL